MKRITAITGFTLISLLGFSQDNYFYHHIKSGEKYFVALGYGIGTAHWNSVFTSTEFYDKDGSVIRSGDLKFTGNSPTKNYDVNVMAPIGHVRVGLGIDFEFHYLSQLKIYSKDGEDYLLFDEGLRFDKMYLQTELPFKFDSNKKYSFSWNAKLGWYGYTNVKRFNFLGEKPLPISFLVNTGVVADYEIYPHVYAYVLPNFEFKYYDNSGIEAPVEIRHNVFSACMLFGVRVDLGRFHN